MQMAARSHLYFLILVLLTVVDLGHADSYPLWKVFCSGVPLFRGRVDSIINPGTYSGHVHKVAGGSDFSAGVQNQSVLEAYNVTKSANCTTCSIHTVDNSNYWHPDLYYRWPNGTFSLVPDGGLTVYYFARTGNQGSAQYYNPNWQPFPAGFRMVAGNSFRRSYNASSVADQAISFVCLTAFGMPPAPETNGFQTANYSCANGFRMQVFFPMCWNGVDLDSADHSSHMAYPTQYNGGDCPSTHPVRLPAVFYEAFYSVDQFPHGNGTQPFVLANGDPTGYGFHGDFLSGWDVNVLKAVLADPSCDANNTANGNRPDLCAPLQPYVKAQVDNNCQLARPIPLTENIGMVNPMNRLPGCNPITYSNAAPCSQGADPSTTNNTGTFHIQSIMTGHYLTYDPLTLKVFANASTVNATYAQVWGLGWAPSNLGRIVSSSQIDMHFTMQDVLRIKGNAANTWEIFSFEQQPNSSYVAIKNLRYGEYLQVQLDFTISGQATNITKACLFNLVTPNGGFVPPGIRAADLPSLTAAVG